MPSASPPPLRHVLVAVVALGALLATTVPVSAQGFGLGARFAWVKQDVDMDADSVRFFGLHMRAIGGRSGFELSFDRHTESFDLINQKVIETPIQASLLVRLAQGSFAPYLLGGPGWCWRTVERLTAPRIRARATPSSAGMRVAAWRSSPAGTSASTATIGTFLDFGGDDEEDEGFIGGLLPGYKGSMWTLGATLYF